MSYLEIGYQLDCEANGCETPCVDNQMTMPWDRRYRGEPDLQGQSPIVNHHLTRWMKRWIPEFEPVHRK